ncbi:hypothetical protein DL96DRAFT_657523 [Flagelloscypha sp. PMI_526]|nr:hypothetical protein DL96DRAFT_657523 [Flagelloscypha sp. PMI_526]
MSFSKRLHATRVKAFLKKLSVLRLAFMLVSKPPRKQTAPPDVSRPPSIVYDISPAQVQDASCLLPPLSSQPNELPSFMIDFGFDGTGEASVVSPPIDAYPPKLAAAADVTLPLKASIKTYHLPTRGIAKNMETELVHRIQVLEQELATERQRFQTSRSACLCGSSSSSAQPCTNTDKNPLSSNTILTIPSEPSSLEDEMTPALCSVPSISSIDALPHLDPAATSSPENHSPDMTWALNHNENYGLETVWTHGPAVFLLDVCLSPLLSFLVIYTTNPLYSLQRCIKHVWKVPDSGWTHRTCQTLLLLSLHSLRTDFTILVRTPALTGNQLRRSWTKICHPFLLTASDPSMLAFIVSFIVARHLPCKCFWKSFQEWPYRISEESFMLSRANQHMELDIRDYSRGISKSSVYI